MLDSFHIEHLLFGFENLHIEGLSRFNLIVGRNGVGKSALLEAIRLNHQGAQMICATDPRTYPYMPWDSAIRAYPQDFMFPRIVLIDEMENGLHHTVYRNMWRELFDACHKYDVQIIATTHSLEMVRDAHYAMSNNTPYELTLFRIEKQTAPTHRVVRYNQERLKVSFDQWTSELR